MTDWGQAMEALAREHLPEDVAATWIGLLRPAAQLYPALDGEGGVVGQLGGAPDLPADVEWPWWDEYGPLSFIASVDCAELPALDIALPAAGTLLFFYCDGQVDEETVVGTWDPETQAGARVIYVPPGTPTAEATTPEELDPYPAVPLAVRLVGTEPGWEHFAPRTAFFAGCYWRRSSPTGTRTWCGATTARSTG